MSRIVTVAQSEFLTLVRTRAFIVGILLMPVLMIGFGAFMGYAERHVDTTDRAIAVIDQTGSFFEPLAAAAEVYNAKMGSGAGKTGPNYLLSRVDLGGRSVDETAVELSARVKARRLFAFVVIPADVIDADAHPPVRFFSESTAIDQMAGWLRAALNEEIAKRRFAAAGVDQALVAKLTTRTELATFGLVERAASGGIAPAKATDELSRLGLPIFVLVLMYMAVLTGAGHLLNAVIEEKMSKISEVLLGSVTPVQLLAGKLFGVVGVSLTLTLVYVAGGVYALASWGRADLIDPALLGWFLVFLVCAALLFGSIFLAIGSACTNLKDSQSMIQPVMILIVVAYLASFVVMRAPESNLAVGLSLFPTVTPFAMTLRLAMPPGPPLWQVLLSIVLLVGTTAFVVWAASRIFRVGLLMQGKPPNLPELLKWVRR